MKKHFRTVNPRVKMGHDGRATLAGIQYDDLHSILTAANLHNYDGLKEAKEKLKEAEAVYEKSEKSEKSFMDAIRLDNALIDVAWIERQRWIINALDDSMKSEISRGYPKPVPTLKEQLLANKRHREMSGGLTSIKRS